MSDIERFTLPLSRRVLSEANGSALLLLVIVGSGIAIHRLSTTDTGLQLLANSVATALGLGALIATFGPISGGALQSGDLRADRFLGRRSGNGLSGREVGAYALGQVVGAILGSILANVIFSLPAVTVGPIFANTFDGIAPSPVPWLVAGQLVGAGIGMILVFVLLLPPTGPAGSRRLRRPRMDSAGRGQHLSSRSPTQPAKQSRHTEESGCAASW